MLRHARFLAVVFLVLGVLGCSDKKATAIVIGLSSEARSPQDLDSVTVQAIRDGSSRFSQQYKLDGHGIVPGTLTLKNGSDEDASQPVEIIITGSLGGTPRVQRKARFAFITEHTKLLKLKLEYACFGKLNCPDGTTCVGGSCGSEDIDPNQLGDFVDNSDVVPPTSVASNGTTPGCFDAPQCLPVSTRSPVALLLTSCSFPAPGAAGSFNVGMIWSVDPAHAVVLESDPNDGFAVNGDQVVLSSGLCDALHSGAAIGLFTSIACPTKAPDAPLCADADSTAGGGSGGGAGAGGAAGTSGFAGTSGTSGAGGSSAGAAGKGGFGGVSGAAGAAGVGGAVAGASGAAGGPGGASGAGGAGAGGVAGGGAGGIAGSGGAAGAGGEAAGAGGVAGSSVGLGGAGGSGGSSGASGAGQGGLAGASGAGQGGVAGSSGGAGAAGAGEGGVAGASGAAGSAGIGGALAGASGAGGAGACVGNKAPTAAIQGPLSVDVGGTITLDGTSSSDPEMQALTYVWSAVSGPDPATPNASKTGVTFPDCGTYTYKLTVTDSCNASFSTTYGVTALANGPYVSSSTCDDTHECGTIVKPWCTIVSAASQAKGPTIMVAGATSPYLGEVDLSRPISLQGGYEGTFTQPRVVDPASNNTVITTAQTDGVIAEMTGASTIEGFTIRALDAPSQPTRTLLSVLAGANVTLNYVNFEDAQSAPFAGSAYGISLPGTAAASSITMTNVHAIGPNATSVSAALTNAAAGTGAITTTSGCTFAGGTGLSSYGVLVQGGTVSLTSDVISAANATSNSIALSIAAVAGDTTLSSVTTSAGTASTSIGFDFSANGSITTTGCNFVSGAVNGGTVAGARINSGAYVNFTGGTITGSSGSGSTGNTWGLLITADNAASLNQITIRGGDSGDSRIGIEAPGPLSFDSCSVHGSDTAGGTIAMGAHVVGGSPIASTIQDNIDIIGGDPISNPAGASYTAYGLFIELGAYTVVSNGTIQGCRTGCQGDGMTGTPTAIGYYIGTPNQQTIDTQTIVGGPHIGGGTVSKHYGIFTNAFDGYHYINGNTIIGNSSQANPPAYATGLFNQDSYIGSDNNTYRGGYATQEAIGAQEQGQMQFPKIGTAIDVYYGGDALTSYGLYMTGVDLSFNQIGMFRNVMDACGYATCPTLTAGVGLYLMDSKSVEVSNSYMFGGPGNSSIGCEIGASTASPLGGVYSFYNNMCFAPGKFGTGTTAQGALVSKSATLTLGLYNNIFAYGPEATNRYGLYEQANVSAVNLGNNLFPFDASTEGPNVSYLRTAAGVEEDGQPNINALPNTSNNYVSTPVFVNPVPSDPTAAGYHYDTSNCPAIFGQYQGDLSFDFDNQSRSQLSPNIGPDECKLREAGVLRRYRRDLAG